MSNRSSKFSVSCLAFLIAIFALLFFDSLILLLKLHISFLTSKSSIVRSLFFFLSLAFLLSNIKMRYSNNSRSDKLALL